MEDLRVLRHRPGDHRARDVVGGSVVVAEICGDRNVYQCWRLRDQSRPGEAVSAEAELATTVLLLATGWLGTLPGWLTLAALLAGTYLFVRGGGGTALETLETANRVLVKRVDDLEKSAAKKDQQIAELKGRTDVALAIGPVLKWTIEHESRAQQRHDATLAVLSLIAERLGPESNGEESAG